MTQNETLLAHLRKGASITPLKARHVFGIERLASRIHDLQRMGHRIKRDTRRDEAGGRYMEYRLEVRA